MSSTGYVCKLLAKRTTMIISAKLGALGQAIEMGHELAPLRTEKTLNILHIHAIILGKRFGPDR